METYKIIRFYKNRKKNKIIDTGLTLKEAQEHCRDPSTSSKGKWFDGYESEDS